MPILNFGNAPQPEQEDPLAVMLGGTRRTPTGSNISEYEAEQAPDLLMPESPIVASGSANRENLQKLQNYFGQRSPEFQQEQQHTQQFAQEQADAMDERDPVIREARNKAIADKLAIVGEPARMTAAGALELDKQRAGEAMEAQKQKFDVMKQFLGTQGANSPHMKAHVDAQGQMSFSTNPMSAVESRSRAQLSTAQEQTRKSVEQLERLYPGVTKAAQQSDTEGASPGWGAFLTGQSGKYGGASDLLSAANEKLKYTLGVPTPYASPLQEASFANIEQMAGQIPGIRGVLGLTPLFKEHQSRFGRETPLATVQRLMHMHRIMGDAISTLDAGGGGADEPIAGQIEDALHRQ